MKTNGFDWLAVLLAILGAVTWGIIGVTGLLNEPVNIVDRTVESIFRPGPAVTVEYLIYVLIGVAGVYLFYTAFKMGRASRRATKERRAATEPETTQSETTTDYTDTDYADADYADTDAENTNTES